MSYMEDSIDWQAVDTIDRWLDSGVGAAYTAEPLAQDWARIAKVSEELGEAVAEFILYTGQNPRKGTDPAAYDKFLNEMADTVWTAVLAMQHFTKNTAITGFILKAKLAAIEERVPR